MQHRDVMTKGFQSIGHQESIRRAAQVMRELDVGILPIQKDDRLVGTVTDRDITIRATAAGKAPDDTPVAEVMSEGVLFGYEDEDAQAAASLMEEQQVRRLFVLDRSDRCIGVVSLGDLAVRGQDQSLSGEVLEEVSKPTH